MNKLAYTINEACEVSGIGRTSIYKLIKQKKLTPRKRGSRTLILAEELRTCLESLPVAEMSEAAHVS